MPRVRNGLVLSTAGPMMIAARIPPIVVKPVEAITTRDGAPSKPTIVGTQL